MVFISVCVCVRERERERERVREKKGEKYLDANWPSTGTTEMVRPFWFATTGKRRATMAGERGTTTRRGAAEVTEWAAPASSGGATVGLVCSGCLGFLFCSVFCFSFALYLVSFFFFSDKRLCIAVLGNRVWFVFALYRVDCLDLCQRRDRGLISDLLCYFFFFGWESMGFATSVLCWAFRVCHGQWAWFC